MIVIRILIMQLY